MAWHWWSEDPGTNALRAIVCSLHAGRVSCDASRVHVCSYAMPAPWPAANNLTSQRIYVAQVQAASEALRSLEESRAHLAAIQAAAGQRPSSRHGAFRGPGSHSSGVGRRGARYTLDEAAIILKSLPAVPEGDHPASDGAGIRRRMGLERFLADVQQQPPAKRGDADADYRRMARSLQDQAYARLGRRSGGGGGSGQYPNMGPTSQESLV